MGFGLTSPFPSTASSNARCMYSSSLVIYFLLIIILKQNNRFQQSDDHSGPDSLTVISSIVTSPPFSASTTNSVSRNGGLGRITTVCSPSSSPLNRYSPCADVNVVTVSAPWMAYKTGLASAGMTLPSNEEVSDRTKDRTFGDKIKTEESAVL